MTQQLQLQLFETDDGSHYLNLVTPAEGCAFTADDLSRLIAALSENRAQMLPVIPPEAPQVANMQNVAPDPLLFCAYDEMSDRFALVIRHPGYGWVGYALPVETVTALQRDLGKLVDHRNNQRRAPN
ncbi:hypothetical protein [Burkholderia cepacia]|uniref:hypothetical protein n=1 Tax=Burkholderia cepacia TaxID=292 RepID=UPI000F5E084A|nr:hypothetical protein [Burkholderia cepacia]RRA01887.1 hypothetical protein DF055_19935 [Burkholderia cepacia]RRA04920.1 hypothetical protein DF054_22735 [Burkholderia cepacia]